MILKANQIVKGVENWTIYLNSTILSLKKAYKPVNKKKRMHVSLQILMMLC
jgi:hypothetical protein